jgi:hypothetical protein
LIIAPSWLQTGVKVAPSDPAQVRWVDHSGDRLANERKHAAHAGVEQQRLVVFDEEVVELQVEILDVQRDAIEIRGDFVDAWRHGASSFRQEVSPAAPPLQRPNLPDTCAPARMGPSPTTRRDTCGGQGRRRRARARTQRAPESP